MLFTAGIASSANTDALILLTGASRANIGTRMPLNTGDSISANIDDLMLFTVQSIQCQYGYSDALYWR